jgi:hypothetical protein
MAASKIQQAIDAIKSRQLSLSELRIFLLHPSPLVRANAVGSVAERISEDDTLLDEVVAFAKNPEHTFCLMGTTTLAHMAVLGLLRSPYEMVRHAGKELVKTWPGPDRQDLIWFLKSEGIDSECIEN